MKTTNNAGKNHINPIGFIKVEFKKDVPVNSTGCCIKEGSFIKPAFIINITVLMNKNGISNLSAFFFTNAPNEILFNWLFGTVSAKRNPEMKKNNGI